MYTNLIFQKKVTPNATSILFFFSWKSNLVQPSNILFSQYLCSSPTFATKIPLHLPILHVILSLSLETHLQNRLNIGNSCKYKLTIKPFYKPIRAVSQSLRSFPTFFPIFPFLYRMFSFFFFHHCFPLSFFFFFFCHFPPESGVAAGAETPAPRGNQSAKKSTVTILVFLNFLQPVCRRAWSIFF